MAKSKISLSLEVKIQHTVENIKRGVLIYLLLPIYSWTAPHSTIAMKSLSMVFIGITLLRLTWMRFYPQKQSKKFLWGLYSSSAILAATVSVLSAQSIVVPSDHSPVLFITMLMATFTWGIMVSFSIEPLLSAALGCLVLGPFTVTLATITGRIDWWIVLASSLFLVWNMLHVWRTHLNLLKLQDYEKSLHLQTIRLRQFVNSLPGFVSWFDKDLRYVDANSRLIDLIGMPREDLIGTRLGFRNPNDPFVKKINDFFSGNLAQDVFESSSASATGEEKYFLTMMLRYQQDDADPLIGVLSLDVSTLKRQEQELEKRRLHLQAQERFTALGEITGGIAHEINNPLAIIVGKSDLLIKHKAKGTLTEEMLDRHLQGISHTSQRISRIVNSLKILLRDGVIENIVETTIGGAIEPLLEIIQSRLDGMGVILQVDKTNFDLPVRCGLVEFGQVLMNLIVNSAQAVEGLDEKWVKIEVRSDEQKIYILVKDSGTGISQEVQKKLFQPFFTTKAPGVGTGIGLSLSKELMQKQNGDLYYVSRELNTTFVLELPKVQGKASDSTQAA